MKKIVHASEAISLSALSEKFREEGYKVVVSTNSNGLRLTKNGQSVNLRAFKGDLVFELYADSDERCMLLSMLEYIAFELLGYILFGVVLLIFQSWISAVVALIVICLVYYFLNELGWESNYSKHKAIVGLVSQVVKR